MVVYKCQNCGKVFEAGASAKRKYCSLKCAYEARQGRRIKKKCAFCGKTFLTHPSRIKRGVKYCSLSCAGKVRTKESNPNWRGGKHLVTCESCGKEFWVSTQTRDNPARGRFCSRTCSNRWISKSCVLGRGKKVSLICEICGKEFDVYPSRAGTRRVCSWECANKLKSQQMQGPGNHFWEGGKTKEIYPPEFDERFKGLIRERDGFKCALCGAPGNNVHHIDYEKSNTVPENCITLCSQCHGKLHGQENSDRADNLLMNIAASRTG